MGDEGMQTYPTLNFRNFFVIVFAQKYCPNSVPILILNFVQENVKNCTLILQFTSASGDLVPLNPLFGPVRKFVIHASVNTFHCKILGTPMVLFSFWCSKRTQNCCHFVTYCG